MEEPVNRHGAVYMSTTLRNGPKIWASGILITRIRLQSNCGDQRHKGGGDSPPPLTSALAVKTQGIFPVSGHPG